MRGLVVLFFSSVMLIGSGLILVAASQSGVRMGITIDGIWHDLGPFVVVLAFLKLAFWTIVVAISLAYCFGGEQVAVALRDRTEVSLNRAAEAIKDMVLDLGAPTEQSQDTDRPELDTELLPPLATREFVVSMRGKTEQMLARVAEIINLAPTGQEIAASEEQVKMLLGELRFDALALGLQMRNEIAAGDFVPVSAPSAAAGLSMKSGRAKSYAASDYWRPVWVERYRSMRAADTAFRLAERARRQAAEEN